MTPYVYPITMVEAPEGLVKDAEIFIPKLDKTEHVHAIYLEDLIRFLEESKTRSGKRTLTSEECVARGGHIINTLGGDGCKTSDAFLGEVVGLRCPCVCCKL